MSPPGKTARPAARVDAQSQQTNPNERHAHWIGIEFKTRNQVYASTDEKVKTLTPNH
jgi:hypothetical protein